MTNLGSSPESPPKGFKMTLMKGVIGAVSLAGTTAIPLIIQRVLTPPTAIATPSPAQVTPAASPNAQSDQLTPSNQETSPSAAERGEEKKKKRPKD